MNYLVQLKQITKKFGSVTALQNVDFQVEKGTIHALVGENGAGKTTLMRILYGLLKPNEGHVYVNGKELHFHSASEAIQSHIGMVSQHYAIIPDLTCLENLILGAEPHFMLNKIECSKIAEKLAKQMGFSFDWHAPANTLSPAGAQKLEILKLLWRKAQIMILDEPTAMLSPSDVEALYGSLRRLTEEGATVIVVTHRLPEVINFCDQVTILRGGKRVNSCKVKDTSSKQLAEWIVGHSIKSHTHRQPHLGGTVLELSNVSVLGDRGHKALKNVNLMLHAGEMLGVAGVDGNGQRELFHALVGTTKISEGSINFDQHEISHTTPLKRISMGIRLIPEDRHAEGVIEEWTLAENAVLGYQRMSPVQQNHFINRRERNNLASQIIKKFQTKCSGADAKINNLSGGNQQRFVSARALELNPKLILAFQPSRGLDIDGSQQVYEAIRQACTKGAAAIVVSYDLDELIEECDRIVAMNHGVIHTPPKGKERDRVTIGQLMVGVS